MAPDATTRFQTLQTHTSSAVSSTKNAFCFLLNAHRAFFARYVVRIHSVVAYARHLVPYDLCAHPMTESTTNDQSLGFWGPPTTYIRRNLKQTVALRGGDSLHYSASIIVVPAYYTVKRNRESRGDLKGSAVSRCWGLGKNKQRDFALAEDGESPAQYRQSPLR